MRPVFLSLTALLLSAALLQLGNGIQFTLIPVRADGAAFGNTVIALITVGYFAGFLLGSLIGGRLLSRVGHIRVLTGTLAGISALVLLYPLVDHPAIWVAARAGTGLALVLAYMSIESWLNERAPGHNRGLVLSVYALSGFAMLALAQGVLATIPAAGYEPFAWAAIAFAVAALPVAFSRSPAPAQIDPPELSLRHLCQISRVAVVGTVAVGLAYGAFWAFAPIFAISAGLGLDGVAYFIGATLAGAALMAWPVGALSDRIDRRVVIAVINIGAAFAAALVIASAGKSLLALLSFAFLYGAFAFSIHAVCIAHANDYVAPEEFVSISGGLLFLLGAGSLLGPLAALALIAMVGSAGAFYFAAGVHVIAGVAAFILRTRRLSLPAFAKHPFRIFPRTSSAAYELACEEPASEGSDGQDDGLTRLITASITLKEPATETGQAPEREHENAA